MKNRISFKVVGVQELDSWDSSIRIHSVPSSGIKDLWELNNGYIRATEVVEISVYERTDSEKRMDAVSSLEMKKKKLLEKAVIESKSIEEKIKELLCIENDNKTNTEEK